MAIDVIVGVDELKPIRYEHAAGLQSPDSGALVLLNTRGAPVAAYAPGAWFMAEVAGSGERTD